MLVALVLLILLVCAGALYQAVHSAQDRREFPPLGRIIDGVHIFERGSGSPTVVFESGIAASCLNWNHVQSEVAEFTRTMSYDRPGLGWSNEASSPRVVSQLIEELDALLTSPPYILVAHSFGGLIATGYSAKYPTKISALVLVDPLHASDWLNVTADQARTLRRGVNLSRRGALLARLGVVRGALSLLSRGSSRVPKLIAKMSSGRGQSTVSRLVGEVQKMPREVWPMVQAHWCQPKSFIGMAAYLESLPASAIEAASFGRIPAIPVTILSAGNSTPAQLAERERIATKHIIASHCGHWIHLDDPALVVEAIREAVNG